MQSYYVDQNMNTNKLQISSTPRRDVPVGVPLDLSTMEWHELLKYNGQLKVSLTFRLALILVSNQNYHIFCLHCVSNTFTCLCNILRGNHTAD